MKTFILFLWELFYAPVLMLIASVSRLAPRQFDVGVGPEPLINNVYHAEALKRFGYRSETFVRNVFFITHRFDKIFFFKNKLVRFAVLDCLNFDFLYVLFSYESVYIYFNGGPLQNTILLWRIEPFLFKLAHVKIVVMPYGSDVHLLDQTQNLPFKNRMVSDYPDHKYLYEKMQKKRTLWIKHADCVIGGCDWVDYLYHWDKLMVSHFSIDTAYLRSIKANEKPAILHRNKREKQVFRIFHAPNHKKIKGTASLVEAVKNLQKEGYRVELMLAEKKPNKEILQQILQADLVVDQLIVGWYAMFAIEAMSLGKPVICFLRDDLLSFYRVENLIASDEPPLINANPTDIQSVIKACLNGDIELELYARRGVEYVEKMHSLAAIGSVFHEINQGMAISTRLNSSSEIRN